MLRMKKLLFFIVPIIFLNSCGKVTNSTPQESKKIIQFKYNSAKKEPSMLVDINCVAALPGNNDWNEKNILLNSNNSINIIQYNSCSVAIKKYTSANGSEYLPKSNPLVLSIDEAGSGNSATFLYYKTSDNTEINLKAEIINYQMELYEKNSPIKLTNGIISYSQENLLNIVTIVNIPKKIIINFTPTGGSIENLSASFVKMDSEFKSAWKFEGPNNCLNITNFCKITLVFTPTKETFFQRMGAVNITYYNGSVQTTMIPLYFSADLIMSRMHTPTPTDKITEAELLQKLLEEEQKEKDDKKLNLFNSNQTQPDNLLPTHIE